MHQLRKPIQSLDQLPDGSEVQKFLHIKAKEQQLKNLKSCFLVALDLKEAYLFVAFCFGDEQKIINNLPMELHQQDTIKRLKDQLFKPNKKKLSSQFNIFKQKAERLGNLYDFLRRSIIDKLSEYESEGLFNQVIKSHLLNGVKIRKWKYGSYDRKYKIKREFQRKQLDRVNGNHYLLISQTKNGSYNVGVVYFDNEFNTISDAQQQRTQSQKRQLSAAIRTTLIDKNTAIDERKSFSSQPKSTKTKQTKQKQMELSQISNLPQKDQTNNLNQKRQRPQNEKNEGLFRKCCPCCEIF